tara:strand:- start:5948 stop:6190 length:243 start_codon:yes stop_codon:yes gene_type:complete
MLRCRGDTLYTGITTDIDRRVNEHNVSSLGAKYTRSRRPVALVYTEPASDRSSASKREYQIKQMTKKQKERMIEDHAKKV